MYLEILIQVFAVIKAIESLIEFDDSENYSEEYSDLLMFICTDVEIEIYLY